MFDLKHIAKTLILLGVLALPGAAAAAQGDLTYAGCVGDDATQDCVALPGSPIKGLTDVAVSPDGRSVYAVSPDHDTVAHFFRGPDGTLAYDGCVGNTVQGCAPVPDASLGGPNRVTVSPDGKSVYVTTRLGNGVVELKRALPDGQITFAACAADPNPADACGDLKQATLLEPQAVTVSPDGKSVYVGGAGSSTVVHFLRSSSGGLTFDSCVSTGALTNTCAKTSSPMERPIDLTVSRDGRNVYVLTEGEPATPNRAAVYVFGRVEEGQITLIGCHSSNALGNCFDVPGDPFTAAGSLQLSSLDRSLYVLGAGGTLSRMTREVVSGGLNYSSAFANPFTATQGLSMSPDGRSLYLLGTASVAHLTVGTTGDPAFSSCLASDPGAGCVDLPGTPLARPETSAVSPDGRTVYVADRAGSRIHRFDRDLTVATPTPTPTASPTATPTVSATATPIATPVSTPEATPEPTVDPDPVVVTCAGRPATVVGTAGADRLRGTPAADVVAALGGGDRVSGLRGDDVVCGGAGRDRMAAGAGRDRCIGGAGRDRAKGCEVRRTI